MRYAFLYMFAVDWLLLEELYILVGILAHALTGKSFTFTPTQMKKNN